MRISQVMLSRGFGGAERFFVDLCRALAAAGHAVQALCHPGFVGLERLRCQPNITIVPIRCFGWWDPVAQARVRSALRTFQPAVVQAHLSRGAYLAGRAAAALDLPVCVKLHNYVKMKYYGRIDCFIPTTRDQAAFLRSRGIHEDRIRLIPNFSRLSPVGKPRPMHRPPVLLSYGRFVHKKGFVVLLQALAQLHARGVEFQLQLGGDGPDRSTIERAIRRYGLGDRVRLPGWLHDVQSALEEADIFVLPSLDEPFGIAILEAMARGVPIVATRSQGPREILTDETAWLSEPGDVEALAAALGSAIEAPDLCREKAAAAQALFRQTYSEQAVVPQYLALYRQLAL
jgi:glycosyltransferase involved in cell wall biosynthesis